MDRPKHILVVDDDGDVLDVIAATLEDRGYRVSTATNAVELRAFLEADGVDAVVLDGSMYGESSASLAAHLKDLQLPLVMISGEPGKIEAAEKGNLQLLRKPFRANELFDALNKAFASGVFGQRDSESPGAA
jgi:DNA-binding NtrC family response regulator